MISYFIIATYDIAYSIVLILLILYDVVDTISDRIAVSQVCIDRIIFVSIENSIVNIWNIESSSYSDACYYAYQDK